LPTDIPTSLDFRVGNIRGNDIPIGMGDVLELLKFLAGVENNVITQSGGIGTRAWHAALIMPSSRTAEKPGLADVLEILKYLAKIENNEISKSKNI